MSYPLRIIANKPCAFCGADMARIRYPGGRLENANAFERRRFCSRACGAAGRRSKPGRDEMLDQIREMVAQQMSASAIGLKLGVSRNAIVGLARRHGIGLVPPLRLTQEERLERRARYERNRRQRLASLPRPRKARKPHIYRKPGRLVASMMWGGRFA